MRGGGLPGVSAHWWSWRFSRIRRCCGWSVRAWVYWRKRKGLSSIGFELAQEVTPGARVVKQSLEQERVRKNVRPAEEPPFRVDLNAGVVRVRRSGPAEGEPRKGAAEAEPHKGTAEREPRKPL